jgi:uncharacterized protein YdeI (YjbR/CyaY-like superfamily)
MERNDKSLTVTVPPALKKALAKEPRAKAIFEKLPPSHRREHVKWIVEAKQEETIKRRVEKMIPMLLEKDAAKANRKK